MVKVQYLNLAGDLDVITFETMREFFEYCKQYPDLDIPWLRITTSLRK